MTTLALMVPALLGLLAAAPLAECGAQASRRGCCDGCMCSDEGCCERSATVRRVAAAGCSCDKAGGGSPGCCQAGVSSAEKPEGAKGCGEVDHAKERTVASCEGGCGKKARARTVSGCTCDDCDCCGCCKGGTCHCDDCNCCSGRASRGGCEGCGGCDGFCGGKACGCEAKGSHTGATSDCGAMLASAREGDEPREARLAGCGEGDSAKEPKEASCGGGCGMKARARAGSNCSCDDCDCRGCCKGGPCNCDDCECCAACAGQGGHRGKGSGCAQGAGSGCHARMKANRGGCECGDRCDCDGCGCAKSGGGSKCGAAACGGGCDSESCECGNSGGQGCKCEGKGRSGCGQERARHHDSGCGRE